MKYLVNATIGMYLLFQATVEMLQLYLLSVFILLFYCIYCLSVFNENHITLLQDSWSRSSHFGVGASMLPNGGPQVPNIQRHATWKACLRPRTTILDWAWVSPPDLPVSSLSVHCNTSQPVLDFAMIMFRLPRSAAGAAGLGYAGTCRPLYRTGLLLRWRVDHKKMRDPAILLEWRRLLDISLYESSSPLFGICLHR